MSLAAAVIRPSPDKVTTPFARKRALVVDDSGTILHAICTLLEHHQIVEVVGRVESWC
jgi:hypothetical protein